MPVSRGIALAAALLLIQVATSQVTQASALQTTELAADLPVARVGYFHVEPTQLPAPVPLKVSVGDSEAYGRTATSGFGEAPRASGALAGYYAAGAASAEWSKHQGTSVQGWARGDWHSGFGRWQFEESSRNWHTRFSHWHDSDRGGHHASGEDGDCDHPPAVPIPASCWLFASGLGWLAFMRRKAGPFWRLARR